MALADQNATLEFQQRYLQDRFHRYRIGLPRAGVGLETIVAQARAGDPAAAARLAIITARPLPRPGNFQFTQGRRDTLRAIAVRNRVSFRGLDLSPVRPLSSNSKEAIKDQLNNVRALLITTFRFVKCLGWGGNGIVTLWRYKPPGGQEHRVVMKQPTETDSSPGGSPTLVTKNIFAEKNIMSVCTNFKEPFPRVLPRWLIDSYQMLRRAPHIMQRFIMRDHPAGGPANPRRTRSSARVQAMADTVDNAEGYILMDFSRFGTLEYQLTKAAVDSPNGSERYFPDSVLWRIFDCLVKACIAMECPPRFAPGNAAPGADFPLSISGGHLPEVVAVGNGPRARGIVHFDIDPGNVFVRDFDAPAAGLGHTAVPRIQIGDFGAAKFEADLWLVANTPTTGALRQVTIRREKWNRRQAGKLVYSLPEQFSKDWDMIGSQLDPSDPGAWMTAPWVPPPPISTGPGRYTSASNIWHIGRVMHVCMTLCFPENPPYAGRMTTEEPVLPAGVPVPAGQERWTYGWTLLNQEPWCNMYQQPLLDLVARCLMAKQEFRPTLQQIQTIIAAQLSIPDSVAGTVPAYWTNTFFSVPRPPQPPRDTEFADPLDPFWDYRAQKPVV